MKLNKNTEKHPWKIMWECITMSWHATSFFTFMQLVCKIINVALPIIMTWNTTKIIGIFQDLSNKNKSIQSLEVNIFLMLIFVVLGVFFKKIELFIKNIYQDLLTKYIESELISKALTMDLEYFYDAEYYDAFENMKRDLPSLIGIVEDGISCLCYFLSTLSCSILLFSSFPFYVVLLIITSIPAAWVDNRFMKKTYLWNIEHQTEQRKRTYLYYLSTDKRFAQDIRVNSLEKFLLTKYQEICKTFFEQKKRISAKKLKFSLIVSVFPEIIIIIVLFNIGVEIVNGIRGVNEFVFYSGIFSQMHTTLSLLIVSIIKLYENKLKMDQIQLFSKFEKSKISKGILPISDIFSIEFKNVTFSYPGTSKKVLNEINFKITKGEKVCIIGENGSGKSTIIKLLMRFYEINDGVILVNEIPIQNYEINSLRKNFSCYFQNSENYAFTVKENIILSQAKENDKQLRTAITKSGFKTVISKLKNGLDTNVSRLYDKDGVEFSPGQSQKLCLARTFYRSSSVIVLDEPTSAIDAKSERELIDVIKEENNTVILVSHHLSNIKVADRILFLEEGRVLEVGKHEDLIKKLKPILE